MLFLFSKNNSDYDYEEKSIFYKFSLLVIDFYILSFLSLMILNIKIYYLCKSIKIKYPLMDCLLPNMKGYVTGYNGYYLKIFLFIAFSYIALIIVKKICQKILN